jgi:hypothetical protein
VNLGWWENRDSNYWNENTGEQDQLKLAIQEKWDNNNKSIPKMIYVLIDNKDTQQYWVQDYTKCNLSVK